MSGLIATYQPETFHADRSLLSRMLDRIAHRGVDDRGIWTEGRVGLAANLNRITPESSSEKAVTVSAKLNCRLIWDGRIDNREELLPELHLPADVSDPELLLEAYGRWGLDCLKKIIGEFAFVLWDEKTQSLFAGRDRIGVKPFYYLWDGQVFFMSSEEKPLFEALGNVPKPDDEMVFSLLSYCHFDRKDFSRTFFEGVLRLPPGHCLQIQGGKLHAFSYWAIEPTRTLQYAKEEAYAEEFRRLFAKAVKARLRSSIVPSLFLSGGLDSSAIASMAKAAAPEICREMQAVNFYSPNPASDERSYAKEVARHTGIRLHELFTQSRNPLAKLGRSLYEAEMPILGIGTDREPIEFLRDRGIRVVLSGEGADQILDEDAFPADLFTRMKLFEFVRKTFRYAAYYAASPWIFIRESLPLILPLGIKNLWRAIKKNLPPPFLNRSTAAFRHLQDKIVNPGPRLPFHSYAQQASYQNVVDPYFVFKLEIDEHIYARHGMDIRYPFLDSRLVEFVLSLPWHLRAKGVRKWILRTALKEMMPSLILNRKGKGDGTPLMDETLRALCRQEVPEPLANRSDKMHRYVRFDKVRAMVAQYLAGKTDLRVTIWFIIQMDYWLKQFQTGERNEKQENSGQEEIQSAALGQVR